MKKTQKISKLTLIVAVTLFAGLLYALFYVAFQWNFAPQKKDFVNVFTVFGFNREIGEPFGIAEKDGDIFVSDGENGKIIRISGRDVFTVVTDKLSTPSAIAFDPNGDLIVADSGSHTIKRVKLNSGEVELLAGIDGQPGFRDGDALSSTFHAPIGIAVSDTGKIYVADTYNDRIRIVENGKVSTIAGSSSGFSDGTGSNAKFNTPCGIALTKDGKLLVADSGNARLRAVETDGKVWTLSGGAKQERTDDLVGNAAFVRPTAIAVDESGIIYVADGNAIRAIGRRAISFVETLSGFNIGFQDGNLSTGKFNRPSGLALNNKGELLIADSENQVIRVLSGSKDGKVIKKEEIAGLRLKAEEFRSLETPRWTYDPPEKPREIAGTLGEVRGEVVDQSSQVWFHNGLDIAGGYGEKAFFIRSEAVLDPFAVQNFGTLRELIRMPTMGYIHIRLGRNAESQTYDDRRFQFGKADDGKLNLRIPRGSKFKSGEKIGTLNSMNHVHLVAGRRGNEMNALDALTLPGVSDSRAPTIENLVIYRENWSKFETDAGIARIKKVDKIRIIAQGYDQMDGNAERRRLGIYRLGYQILNNDQTAVTDAKWTINFDRYPSEDSVKFVYAPGSKSGATGQTIFNYIVSNNVSAEGFSESFVELNTLPPGKFVIRVFAADYFGNQTFKDIAFELED